MPTAVDANAIFDVIVPGSTHGQASQDRLTHAGEDGPLVLSELVYSELSGSFPSRQALDTFLSIAGIDVVRTGRTALFAAGTAWRAYAARRGAPACGECGQQQPSNCTRCGNPLRS